MVVPLWAEYDLLLPNEHPSCLSIITIAKGKLSFRVNKIRQLVIKGHQVRVFILRCFKFIPPDIDYIYKLHNFRRYQSPKQ